MSPSEQARPILDKDIAAAEESRFDGDGDMASIGPDAHQGLAGEGGWVAVIGQ